MAEKFKSSHYRSATVTRPEKVKSTFPDVNSEIYHVMYETIINPNHPQVIVKRRPRWEIDARRELFQAALEYKSIITARHSGSAGTEARKNRAWEIIVGKLLNCAKMKIE